MEESNELSSREKFAKSLMFCGCTFKSDSTGEMSLFENHKRDSIQADLSNYTLLSMPGSFSMPQQLRAK
jgi:hypothetical protein